MNHIVQLLMKKWVHIPRHLSAQREGLLLSLSASLALLLVGCGGGGGGGGAATVNAEPVATADLSGVTNEDETVTVTLSGTDADDDPLTFSVSGNPDNGSVTLEGAVATYTPNADFNGNDSFNFSVSDGSASSSASVSLSVSAVNDAPVLDAIENYSIKANSTITIPVSLIDIDNDVELSVSMDGNATAAIENALVTITPAEDYVGDIVVIVTASDAVTVEESFTLTVEPVEPGNLSTLLIVPGESYNFSQDLPDAVSYSIQGLTVPGVDFDQDTGVLSRQPDAVDLGDEGFKQEIITVTATSDSGVQTSVTKEFIVFSEAEYTEVQSSYDGVGSAIGHGDSYDLALTNLFDGDNEWIEFAALQEGDSFTTVGSNFQLSTGGATPEQVDQDWFDLGLINRFSADTTINVGISVAEDAESPLFSYIYPADTEGNPISDINDQYIYWSVTANPDKAYQIVAEVTSAVLEAAGEDANLILVVFNHEYTDQNITYDLSIDIIGG